MIFCRSFTLYLVAPTGTMIYKIRLKNRRAFEPNHNLPVTSLDCHCLQCEVVVYLTFAILHTDKLIIPSLLSEINELCSFIHVRGNRNRVGIPQLSPDQARCMLIRLWETVVLSQLSSLLESRHTYATSQE
jgi:hypothetical protein